MKKKNNHSTRKRYNNNNTRNYKKKRTQKLNKNSKIVKNLNKKITKKNQVMKKNITKKNSLSKHIGGGGNRPETPMMWDNSQKKYIPNYVKENINVILDDYYINKSEISDELFKKLESIPGDILAIELLKINIPYGRKLTDIHDKYFEIVYDEITKITGIDEHDKYNSFLICYLFNLINIPDIDYKTFKQKYKDILKILKKNKSKIEFETNIKKLTEIYKDDVNIEKVSINDLFYNFLLSPENETFMNIPETINNNDLLNINNINISKILETLNKMYKMYEIIENYINHEKYVPYSFQINPYGKLKSDILDEFNDESKEIIEYIIENTNYTLKLTNLDLTKKIILEPLYKDLYTEIKSIPQDEMDNIKKIGVINFFLKKLDLKNNNIFNPYILNLYIEYKINEDNTYTEYTTYTTEEIKDKIEQLNQSIIKLKSSKHINLDNIETTLKEIIVLTTQYEEYIDIEALVNELNELGKISLNDYSLSDELKKSILQEVNIGKGGGRGTRAKHAQWRKLKRKLQRRTNDTNPYTFDQITIKLLDDMNINIENIEKKLKNNKTIIQPIKDKLEEYRNKKNQVKNKLIYALINKKKINELNHQLIEISYDTSENIKNFIKDNATKPVEVILDQNNAKILVKFDEIKNMEIYKYIDENEYNDLGKKLNNLNDEIENLEKERGKLEALNETIVGEEHYNYLKDLYNTQTYLFKKKKKLMNLISEKDANKNQLLADITEENYIDKKIEKLEKEKKNLENWENDFNNLYEFITNIEEDKKDLTKIRDILTNDTTNDTTNVKNNLVNFLNEKLGLEIFELGEEEKLNLKNIENEKDSIIFKDIFKDNYKLDINIMIFMSGKIIRKNPDLYKKIHKFLMKKKKKI